MKLIELLVQELPKRGGWPDKALVITQDLEGELCLWEKTTPFCCDGYWGHHSGTGLHRYWCGEDAMSIADDHSTAIVTREQYEAALAAAQQPVWNGEGLPPVGCECEFFDCEKWFKVTMMYGGSQLVVLFDHGNQIERTFSTSRIDGKFRPVRSESDKKRAEIIEEIAYHTSLDDARDLYEAIAAGQVKGVKLDV